MKNKSRLILTVCGVLAMLCGTDFAVQAAEIDPVNPPKSARVPAIGNAATDTNGKGNARLSAGLEDVVKLVQAGVDESVILAFIESSSVAYRPGAPEILKLRELGLTSPIIAALLRRGEEVREVRRRATEAQREAAARNAAPAQPPPAPAVSTPPPQQPAAPPPTVINYTPVVYPATYPTVVYSSYPTYRYYPTYYSYGYRNCYYPRSYYSSYSCYPRGGYYGGGYYSRSSLSVGFRGGYSGGYGGYRYCR